MALSRRIAGWWVGVAWVALLTFPLHAPTLQAQERFVSPLVRAATEPTVHPATVVVHPERGLIPPGLLRYGIPERARPLAAPYAAAGVALLAADPYVLRALRLDSLYLREVGTSAHEAHLAFRAFSRLGDPEVVALLLGALYAAGASRERNAARVGGVAYFNALALTAAGKFLTGKERPRASGGRVRYHGPGLRHTAFPSGHASGTAALAHVLGHYYPDARLAWYGLSGLTGVSRVALAEHWPSDVWWGWGAGVVGAEGALGERERIERWRPW